MAQNVLIKRKIYDKTDGYCHICHKKISFNNYARFGERGCWEIDHSNPKAQGGTDSLNNLLAACISCNRSKQANSSRSARSRYGHQRAPYSKAKKQSIKQTNTALGALTGAVIGLMGGPIGVVLGATIGGVIGNNNKISKNKQKNKLQ